VPDEGWLAERKTVLQQALVFAYDNLWGDFRLL
jgi:hypothetical protein